MNVRPGFTCRAVGGVDPAGDLDRSVRGPAAVGPVRRVVGVRRERHPGDPLAGADEPVETGDHHPRREPVCPRQRPAVHADGDHGVAAVGGQGERRADRHPVDVGGQDLVGAAADAGAVEQVGQADAEPARAADVGTADVVGDAGERDVALDQGHRQQVVEREGLLLADVAVDGQRPGVGVDDRQREPGVDAVEVAGRGPEGGDAGDPVVETAREGLRGGLRPREGDVADRLARVGDHAAGVPARRRDGRDTCCSEEHGAATEVGTDRGTRNHGLSMIGAGETGKDSEPDQAGHDAGDGVTRVHDRPAQHGVQRDRDEDREQGRAEAERPPREEPRDAREHEDAGEDGADQDRLVVGAEVGDRPVLDRCRRVVDHQLTDGEHR